MSDHISRAGRWFLRSGIQAPEGGVARYYRADRQRNNPVSTEITGYTASALVYLHTLRRDEEYLEAAGRAARYLTRTAWDAAQSAMPFELDPPSFTYFFDCGVIVRGLLSVWRATGEEEFAGAAAALGKAMAADFPAADGLIEPILSLPGKKPQVRDPLRWSASPGCYQLKAAMAWWDLAEATGDSGFREPYERALESSLRSYQSFLPGHPERNKVMDRVHAFCYFLEGLLPCASDRRCAEAVKDGIKRTEAHVREIAPAFARSDVYAQLLRIRVFADWTGSAPLDRDAACREAATLAGFQAAAASPAIDGGYYFGRKESEWLPYINPVSTAFAMQALALWEQCQSGAATPQRHLLI